MCNPKRSLTNRDAFPIVDPTFVPTFIRHSPLSILVQERNETKDGNIRDACWKGGKVASHLEASQRITPVWLDWPGKRRLFDATQSPLVSFDVLRGANNV